MPPQLAASYRNFKLQTRCQLMCSGVEKLLNHATDTISGVAAIYNRFQYLDVMRAAIDLWKGKLRSLIGTARLAA